MELRTVYHLEATAHRNMLGRAKGGTYTVAPEFRDFRRFLAHVGPCPAEGWTLDRKDPRNPVYGPGLVRWADKVQQANNRTTTIFLTMDGITRPLAEWAALKGVDRRTLAKRIERRWTHEEAIRGRRREDEPKTAPVPAVTHAEPLADGWPTGSTPTLWEPAFEAYRRQFRGRAVPGLARSTFFAWIAGNLLRTTMARLRDRYPGYDDPDATEPPAVREDREYALVQALEGPVAEARRAVLADPAAHDLLRNLRQRWPNITNPARVGEVARHDYDD